MPQSTVHTPHSDNTVSASASNSQTLASSGNGRRDGPGIKVPHKKSPLKESRSDLTGYSQKVKRKRENGVSTPLYSTLERNGGGGRTQHHGLYIGDLANLMMKMSELEERVRPKAENE